MRGKSLIERMLFEFINKHTLNSTKRIESKTLIFKEGIFDSMGFVLLIDFIEKNFNIETFDTDIIEENFESISAIANFIIKKQIKNTSDV